MTSKHPPTLSIWIRVSWPISLTSKRNKSRNCLVCLCPNNEFIQTPSCHQLGTQWDPIILPSLQVSLHHLPISSSIPSDYLQLQGGFFPCRCRNTMKVNLGNVVFQSLENYTCQVYSYTLWCVTSVPGTTGEKRHSHIFVLPPNCCPGSGWEVREREFYSSHEVKIQAREELWWCNDYLIFKANITIPHFIFPSQEICKYCLHHYLKGFLVGLIDLRQSQ